VKVQKEYTAPFSSPTPSPLRSAQKIQEQVTAAVSQPPAAESHVSSSNTFENGNGQESEGAWSLNCSGVFFFQIFNDCSLYAFNFIYVHACIPDLLIYSIGCLQRVLLSM